MIRPRACWGAACDLLGMSVVYPAGGAVTISKKFLLIRILSKRADCIECGRIVKATVCVRLLIDPARLQSLCNIPEDKGRYPLDEGGGVVLHAGAHPFQRQADEGVTCKNSR